MASVSLPDHAVEVRTLARREGFRFGLDAPELFAANLGRSVLEDGDHSDLAGSWGQLAYVRGRIRDRIGPELFARRLELEDGRI
jgi:hypothetical protein